MLRPSLIAITLTSMPMAQVTGEPSITSLLDRLGDTERREGAITALAERANVAVPEILDQLAEAEGARRDGMLEVLRRLPDRATETVPVLTSLLRERPPVRPPSVAGDDALPFVTCLVDLAPRAPESRGSLFEIANYLIAAQDALDRSDERRWAPELLKASLRIPPDLTLDQLAAVAAGDIHLVSPVDHESIWQGSALRAVAARRLASRGPAAVGQLQPLAKALRQLHRESDREEPAPTDHLRQALVTAMLDIDRNHPLTAAAWRERLDPGKPRECVRALSYLGRAARDAEYAVPDVLALLEAEDRPILHAAIDVLGRIGPPAKAAVPRLRRLQSDPSEETRALASEALRRITDQ